MQIRPIVLALRARTRLICGVRARQAIAGDRDIPFARKCADGSRIAGGKSELHRVRCRVTPGGGDAKESATENKPPATCKRCRQG